MKHLRYRKNPKTSLPDRTWPEAEITAPPIWCSVDLRDGNQALVDPMSVDEKIEFFKYLIKMGFKEIEVGFPAASQIEYDFLRRLIDLNLIPDDVYIQVLCQCRKDLIERTFDCIKGCKNVIFHIYNSTSTLQREVVFKTDEAHIIEIAVNGVNWVKECKSSFDGNLVLEYSPESFTGTELPFALQIVSEVQSAWGADKSNPVIINLPSTVEMNTPNVYADQIEWMSRHFSDRESIILSIHPHNDRGTGVAAAELAMMAGAQRVEGTLFGNGERTGNLDILNVAYNLFSQGIAPNLYVEDVNEAIEIYERCCKIQVHPRHPYAGKLVFTAFSGSHQDAINKGVAAMNERGDTVWRVPYLPIDPSDIGREYEPIVRINSQSGKGGVAFVMDSYFGFKMPKGMRREFADVIQRISEKVGEVPAARIMDAFRAEYLDKKEPLHFLRLSSRDLTGHDDFADAVKAEVTIACEYAGKEEMLFASGNGPIDAAKQGIANLLRRNFEVLDYSQHSLGGGSDAQAAAYIWVKDVLSEKSTYGVGVSSNITRAGVRALFSAVNRLI